MTDFTAEEEFLKRQMNHKYSELIEEFEGKIPYLVASSGEPVTVSTVLRLLKLIENDGDSVLHRSIIEMLFRLLEIGVISHPYLLRLSEIWDSILGTVEEDIKQHLRDTLEEEPSERVVQHIYKCLGGETARHGRHNFDLNTVFDELLDQILSSGARELKCSICGFHFRKKDLSEQRYRKAVLKGLTLEKVLIEGRADDPYKPVQIEKQLYTTLTVDHIVPQETLGWSKCDNLRIVCGFCNMGKGAYRWPLESVSQFIIGGLSNYPLKRKYPILRSVIVVATLRSQKGQCSSCGRNNSQIELTVRPCKNQPKNSCHGFSPWNLRTICYPCLFQEETS